MRRACLSTPALRRIGFRIPCAWVVTGVRGCVLQAPGETEGLHVHWPLAPEDELFIITFASFSLKSFAFFEELFICFAY